MDDPLLSEKVACVDVMSRLAAMLKDSLSRLCGGEESSKVLRLNGGEGCVGVAVGGGAVEEVGGAGERGKGVVGGGGGGAEGTKESISDVTEHQVRDVLCQGLHLLKIIRYTDTYEEQSI